MRENAKQIDGGDSGGDAAPGGDFQEFALAPVVEAAVRRSRPELGQAILLQRIKPLRVLGAADAICRVLAHLLARAGAATRAIARPGVIYVDAEAIGGRVRIRVSDNGRRAGEFAPAPAGAGADNAGVQVQAWREDLAISCAIVRAHGGNLRCVRRLPHGSRYIFDVPAAEGADTNPRFVSADGLRHAPASPPPANLGPWS